MILNITSLLKKCFELTLRFKNSATMNKSGFSVAVILFLISVFFDINSIECKKKKKDPPRHYSNIYETRRTPVQLKPIVPNGQTTNDKNSAEVEKPKPINKPNRKPF